MTNSKTNRLWVLGASDPEMEIIEKVLRQTGEDVAFAFVDGQRVHPGNTYATNQSHPFPRREVRNQEGHKIVGLEEGTVYVVESGEPALNGDYQIVYLDHHRPGDLGYGKSAAEYLAASSLGQVLATLGLEPSAEQRLAAAADHCLAAAYRGECPGVDPEELMRWRIATRAKFQNLSEDELLARVERARQIVRLAPELYIHGIALTIRDCRPIIHAPCGAHSNIGLCQDVEGEGCWGDVPELPEAAAREGVAYLAIPKPGRDKRQKIVLGSASPEQVQWFLREYPAKDKYGDPARGFAGGYIT